MLLLVATTMTLLFVIPTDPTVGNVVTPTVDEVTTTAPAVLESTLTHPIPITGYSLCFPTEQPHREKQADSEKLTHIRGSNLSTEFNFMDSKPITHGKYTNPESHLLSQLLAECAAETDSNRRVDLARQARAQFDQQASIAEQVVYDILTNK